MTFEKNSRKNQQTPSLFWSVGDTTKHVNWCSNRGSL